MCAKKTKDNGEKDKSDVFNFGPIGHGIPEMMANCCAGQGGFTACASMMECMMKEIRKQHCTPEKDADEFHGRKK